MRDAVALLRLDDLYVECFEIKDVKVGAWVLACYHWSARDVGRALGERRTKHYEPIMSQELHDCQFQVYARRFALLPSQNVAHPACFPFYRR